MFALIEKFNFDYIMNSQVLWGDYPTVHHLAIYELFRPDNARFVTVIPYELDGKRKKDEDGMNIEQEFYLFLKERKGLHRLFDAWITQYERLGYAGGSVVVENVKQEEMEAIGAFLGCDLRKQKQIHIYWRQMQKAMDNSRFSTCNIEEFLRYGKANRYVSKKKSV